MDTGRAGRCFGFLVNDPVFVETVVSIVLVDFEEKLKEFTDEVRFIISVLSDY